MKDAAARGPAGPDPADPGHDALRLSLRDGPPLRWHKAFFGGAWVLSRHADVEAALRDPRLSAQRTGGWVMDTAGPPRRDPGHGPARRTASTERPHDTAPDEFPNDERQAAAGARGDLRAFQRLFARAMLFVDAPDHARLRTVMNAGFKPAVMQALRPHVEARCAALLDAVAHRPAFDLMEALARPLPAQVIAHLMGVDDDAEADFIGWSDALADFIGALRPTLAQARAAQAALEAMSAHFDALIPARRARPGSDLVSLLVQAEARGEVACRAELLAQCAMLLFAGHETTRNLLGNGVRALLAHPAQWQRLRNEPALLPNAVRELLRYDSPVQYTGRRVVVDFTLHGQPLRRGELVIAHLGAANRDPARHAAPDTLDVARPQPGLLAFGHGPHVCIGASLTLMEAQVALQQLLQRLPDLTLAPGGAVWADNAVYRGLAKLAVATPSKAASAAGVSGLAYR
jgi:cytochrome P450